APSKALRKAGIKPEGRNVYELADGRPGELEYGFARVSLMGEETVTPIIFGPQGSEPILGVLALEGLGISVDPKTGSLKRERARSLKRALAGDDRRSSAWFPQSCHRTLVEPSRTRR